MYSCDSIPASYSVCNYSLCTHTQSFSSDKSLQFRSRSQKKCLSMHIFLSSHFLYPAVHSQFSQSSSSLLSPHVFSPSHTSTSARQTPFEHSNSSAVQFLAHT